MRKELTRQAIHLLLGLIIISLLLFYGRATALIASTILLVAGTLTGFITLKGIKLPVIYSFLKKAERAEEKKLPGKGPLTFLIGILLALSLFPSKTALGALIVLVFGDSVSTLIGKQLGKTKLPNNKTLEGTLAGLIVSFLALQFWFPLNVSLAVALIGMLAEFLPVNDNISIPVVSGIALMFLI